jgi:hypothetical protein
MLRRPRKRYGWTPPEHWGMVCCSCKTPLTSVMSCGCGSWFMEPQPEIGAKVWREGLRANVGTIVAMDFDSMKVRWNSNNAITGVDLSNNKWHRIGDRS